MNKRILCMLVVIVMAVSLISTNTAAAELYTVIPNGVSTNLNIAETDGDNLAAGNNATAGAVTTEKFQSVTTPDASNNATSDIDANETEPVYVATIGSEGFETLSEAVASAKDGQTVKLIANIDLANEPVGKLDGRYNTYFKVEGKSITVNLNGKTVSGEYTGDNTLVGVFSTENGGHLTITGKGTVDVTATSTVYSLIANYEPECSIIIENGTYKLDKAGDSLVYSGCSAKDGQGIYVYGGYFTLGNVGTGKNQSPWIFNCLGKNENFTNVYGGTYNFNVSEQYWTQEVNVLAEVTDNNNGTWTVGTDIAVAMIGNVNYKTLADAIAAAKDGETVKLIADIDLANEPINKLDGAYDTYFKVEGKSVTVDLNGKTVSGEYTGDNMLVGVFSTENGGHLTLTGEGTVDLTATSTVYSLVANYEAGCSVIIKNGTYKLDKAKDSLIYSGYSAENGEGIYVYDGNFTLGNVGTSTNGSPWIFNCLGKNDNFTNVYGGTYNSNVSEQYWIYEVNVIGFVVDNKNGTWTVVDEAFGVAMIGNVGYKTLAEAIAAAKDGETVKLIADIDLANEALDKLDGAYDTYFKVEGKAITVDLNGKTVKGEYKGDNMLVGVFSTENGGRLTLTGEGTVDVTATSTVYSLIANYEPECSIFIENGTYKLDKAKDCLIYSGCSAENNNGIYVHDGNFTLGNVGTSTNGMPWIFNCLGANVRYSNIYGGTYNYNIDNQHWSSEVNVIGFVLDNNNGTWTVTNDVSDLGVAYVDGIVYGSLSEALAAAKDGRTVTLLSDISVTAENATATEDGLSVMFLIEGKSITLDLNGKTIYVDHQTDVTEERLYAVIHVADGAGLTVIGNGGIDVDANDVAPKVAYMFWKRGTTGYLTIENGYYHMDNAEDSIVYTNGSQIVTVNGGTFILDAVGTRANCAPWIFNASGQNQRHIIVNGGTFNADVNHQYWVFEAQIPKEKALKYDEESGLWITVDAVAYVNEQEWASKWYAHNVGYATVEEAEAAVEAIKTVKIGKNEYLSEQEFVTVL